MSSLIWNSLLVVVSSRTLSGSLKPSSNEASSACTCSWHRTCRTDRPEEARDRRVRHQARKQSKASRRALCICQELVPSNEASVHAPRVTIGTGWGVEDIQEHPTPVKGYNFARHHDAASIEDENGKQCVDCSLRLLHRRRPQQPEKANSERWSCHQHSWSAQNGGEVIDENGFMNTSDKAQ